MAGMYKRSYVTAVLAALLCTDVILTAWGLFLPDLWFATFHGTTYNDPEGFLRRCAANWFMFGALQAIALARWRTEGFWLAVVAGARFSDILTDWSYLYFSLHITPLGAVGLLAAGPLNLMAGVYLLGAYRKLRQASG